MRGQGGQGAPTNDEDGHTGHTGHTAHIPIPAHTPSHFLNLYKLFSKSGSSGHVSHSLTRATLSRVSPTLFYSSKKLLKVPESVRLTGGVNILVPAS